MRSSLVFKSQPRTDWKSKIRIGQKGTKSKVNIMKQLELKEISHYFCSWPKVLLLCVMPLNLGSNVEEGIKTYIVEYYLKKSQVFHCRKKVDPSRERRATERGCCSTGQQINWNCSSLSHPAPPPPLLMGKHTWAPPKGQFSTRQAGLIISTEFVHTSQKRKSTGGRQALFVIQKSNSKQGQT